MYPLTCIADYPASRSLVEAGGGRGGDTSDLQFLAQDGTKSPVAQHQDKGLILHMPAFQMSISRAPWRPSSPRRRRRRRA
jgi:hypothetical protein